MLTSELERCGLLACAAASALEARTLLQTHESVGGAAELWLLELSAALHSTLLARPLLLTVLLAAAGVVVLAVRVFLPSRLLSLAALSAAACSATLLPPLALALLLKLLLAGPAACAVRQSAPVMLLLPVVGLLPLCLLTVCLHPLSAQTQPADLPEAALDTCPSPGLDLSAWSLPLPDLAASGPATETVSQRTAQHSTAQRVVHCMG